MAPARGTPRRFRWSDVLWSLVYPRRAHRIVPTVTGVVLVALSLGIGMAAYNSSSNILFLTLALLLTCLILSGVLSWMNVRRVRWALRPASSFRVGHDAVVELLVSNGKRYLPTYGLWFNCRARPRGPASEQRAESTFNARGRDVRAALARAEAEEKSARVPLAVRLDPQGTTQLDWIVQPVKRGLLRLELVSVGSLFPFGFLRKDIGVSLATDVVVWPAPIDYQRQPPVPARRITGEERVSRLGSSNDLMAVRRYTVGDSHRLIHWKASARTRQLLVRQFAAEAAEGYSLWLRTEEEIWPRSEQFEVLVSFAASLAEDLYRAGRLAVVALNDEAPMPVRRIRDVEEFLDRLALVQPTQRAAAARPVLATQPNVVTFAPDGPRGVGAYVNGQLAASV